MVLSSTTTKEIEEKRIANLRGIKKGKTLWGLPSQRRTTKQSAEKRTSPGGNRKALTLGGTPEKNVGRTRE